MSTHIGHIIKDYCYQNKLPVSKVASNLKYSRCGFYTLLNKPDMNVSTLLAISQHLGHNFFQYIWKDTTVLTREEAHKLKLKVSGLEKQVEQLTRENSLLTQLLTKKVE